MKFQQSIGTASLVFALAAAAGCLGTEDNVIDGKPVTGIDVTPTKVTINKGSTLQFDAVLQFGDGTSENVTGNTGTVWNTSDATIASVSPAGIVTAVGTGFVDVSADYKGEKGNERFAVTP